MPFTTPSTNWLGSAPKPFLKDFVLMAGATNAGKQLIEQAASALQDAFGS